MDEVGRLFILRIRDPDVRTAVRGRLANYGATAVTQNIWEVVPRPSEENSSMYEEYWEEELRWFEETIDPRTDVIYIWTVVNGAMIRSSIGGGNESI